MQFYQSLLDIKDTPSSIKEAALKCLQGQESFSNLALPFKECLKTDVVELLSIGIQGSVSLLTVHHVSQEDIMQILDLFAAKYDVDVKISSVLVNSLGKLVNADVTTSNSLLKVVKIVYSIFLTCPSSQVQVMAQSTIYRMVHNVFSISPLKVTESNTIVTGIRCTEGN